MKVLLFGLIFRKQVRACQGAEAFQFFRIERYPFVQIFAHECAVDPFPYELLGEKVARAKGCCDLSALHLKDAHASICWQFTLESVAASVTRFHQLASALPTAMIAQLVNGGLPQGAQL
jgi:hypothetical protein